MTHDIRPDGGDVSHSKQNSDKYPTAAERFLRSLRRQGVTQIFANLGTDHTPLLEAAARIRSSGDGDQIPSFVICPHEFVAMSAAHGHAQTTGNPQAVLVHVDVGTQNLGAAMHNAHRAEAPIFVIAGLAPTTDVGNPGSRDHPVHYFQDVFDQPGIVREYCRWVNEYRPPTDPAETVARGLERAAADNPGPVYVSATRESLETPINPPRETGRSARSVPTQGADANTIASLTDCVRDADRPLVITSSFGRPPADERVSSLVSFAEAAGAGVVEHTPTTLCFPRNHELHLGFNPTTVFNHADLVLLADTDVPWVPAEGKPPTDVPVVQIDTDPTKRTYPRWPFEITTTVGADPAPTLAAVADQLGTTGNKTGRKQWQTVIDGSSTTCDERIDDPETEPLTATQVAATLDKFVDDDTIIVEDAVTSRGAILEHLTLTEPGSYFSKGGAGLGWAGGAAVGTKIAKPNHRVVSLVGDGSYLFTNPTASAWLAAEQEAPTLTIVFDNRGWGAVQQATETAHPDGQSTNEGVPESRFKTSLDLSAPASAVDAYTRVVKKGADLRKALSAAVDAVDAGQPAVLDIKIAR